MGFPESRTGDRSLDHLAEQCGIPAKYIDQLRGVFAGHPQIHTVSLYGSRAMGTFRPGSDIDLCINADEIEWSEFLAIEREIDDLMLPWKLDLSLWHQIENDALKQHIERVGVEFYASARSP